MDADVKSKVKTKVTKPDKQLVKPGELGLILELTVKDKNGKVTDHRVMRGESFVRQFLELLFVQMQGLYYGGAGQPYPETVLYVINISGDRRPVVACHTYYDGIFDCTGGVGETNIGIVVGRGATAPTIDDYALETLCEHGTGTNQFLYGAATFGLPTSDPTTSHFTITRDFSNNSGATITVNEVGVYVKAVSISYTGYSEYHYFMIIRDVISGGIDVPDGQTLTVNYREQATI